MKKIRNKKITVLVIIVIVVSFLVISSASLFFYYNMTSTVSSEVHGYLSELSKQSSELTSGKIESDFSTLEGIAASLSSNSIFDSGNQYIGMNPESLTSEERSNITNLLISLDETIGTTGFMNIGIIAKNGYGYIVHSDASVEDLDIRHYDFNQREHYRQIINGESRYIQKSTENMQSPDETINVLSVPITRDSQVVAVLCGAQNSDEYYSAIVKINSMFNSSESFAVNKNGQKIISSEHELYVKNKNIFDFLNDSTVSIPKGFSISDMSSDLDSGMDGEIEYIYSGGLYHLFYDPSMLETYIITIIPDNAINQISVNVQSILMQLIVLLFAVFLILLIIILVFRMNQRHQLQTVEKEFDSLLNNIPVAVQKTLADDSFTFEYVSDSFINLTQYDRNDIVDLLNNQSTNMAYEPDKHALLQSIDEQLAKGPNITNEYRIVKKDGSVIWIEAKARLVRDFAGKYVLYSVSHDITHTKQLESELNSLYSILNTCIIKFDNLENLKILSSNPDFLELVGFNKIELHVNFENSLAKLIHPDDLQKAIITATEQLEEGNRINLILRLLTKNKEYILVGINAIHTLDETDQKYFHAIVSDLSNQQVNSDYDLDDRNAFFIMLQNPDLQKYDRLTGLLDMNSVKGLIKAYIKNKPENENAALYMFDIDNFSEVNEKMGHAFGDSIISEISAKIASAFRSDDIIGRIGGDRFILLIRKYSDISLLSEKANEICNIFSNIYLNEYSDKKLSASIGIAVIEDNMSFNDAYLNADIAMNHAKSHGKNRYMLYSPSMDAEYAISQVKNSEVQLNFSKIDEL